MSIFVGRFGFLNFDLGGRWLKIRNQRLRKLPNTKFYLNQITFGILIRLIPALEGRKLSCFQVFFFDGRIQRIFSKLQGSSISTLNYIW